MIVASRIAVESLAWLDAIHFAQIEARFRSSGSGSWGGFPGSILHGALGKALYQVACHRRLNACEGCDLLENCGYPALLGPIEGRDPAGPECRGMVRQGLALLAPEERAIRHKEVLHLGFTVFDDGFGALPVLRRALLEMAATGIGTNKITLELEAIYGLDAWGRGQQIWTASALTPGDLPVLSLRALPELPLRDRARVHFTSPLRLLKDRRQEKFLPFEVLMSAVFRRLTTLYTATTGTSVAMRIDPWLDESRAVQLERSQTERREIWRWSSRQGRRHPLHGLTGSAEYAGESLGRFEPFLRIAEQVGIGKGTSFGLGRIRVEAMGMRS